MGRRYWIAVVFVVLLGHSCLTVCSDLTPGWQDHPGSALVLSCCWSALACCCWDHDMATPPPQRSVFSLLLRQLDAESLLGGGVQREGLGMFPGSSRFLERRLEGGSMARAGGLGGALWLERGHWASGQGEAPTQSLVQPHSCGLQGPQPPPFRPVHPLFGWSQAPQTEWSGLAGLPASLSSDRDREAPRGAGQRQAAGERPGDVERPQRRATEAANRDRCSRTEKSSAGEGAALEGGGWLVTYGDPLPPAVLMVLTSLIKGPLAQLNWLVNRNCL